MFGVVKKFGDDRGGALAAELTYYGFLSIFPALLILTTVLGFIGNRERLGERDRQHAVAVPRARRSRSARTSPIPLVGQRPRRSSFGLLILLYGVLGSTQAAQHAMAQVWNVPAVARPGFFPRLVRGLLFFVALGVGVGASTLLSGLVTVAGQSMLSRVAGFVGVARRSTSGSTSPRSGCSRRRRSRPAALVPGAVVGGVGYSILLSIGTALVQHQLQHAQAVYGQFGLVLGLMAWLALVAQLSLYAAELNVVLARGSGPAASPPAHRRRPAGAARPRAPGGADRGRAGRRRLRARTGSAKRRGRAVDV